MYCTCTCTPGGKHTNTPVRTLCMFTLQECTQYCLQVSHNSEHRGQEDQHPLMTLQLYPLHENMIYPKLSFNTGFIPKENTNNRPALPCQVKRLQNICIKDLIFVLNPQRCVSSTLFLTQRHSTTRKNHKSCLSPPALLWFLTTRLAATAHRLRAEASLMISLFSSLLRHIYHPSFIYIFISGCSILAISVLQSAQEIELHAQFAQHYLARHYFGL